MPPVASEIEQLLADEPIPAHLATCADGNPHVAPVWFFYADETVEVLTSGRKLANVETNPRVALSIEKTGTDESEWMVAMQGTASVITDSEAVRDATYRVYSRYLGTDVDAWPDRYRSQYDAADEALLEISIGSATGLY